MNTKIYKAMQDLIDQLNKIGLAELNTKCDGNISTLVFMIGDYLLTHGSDDGFKITSVAREDLEGIGFDTSNVDDGTMEHLASKMADAYCDNGFWIDLPILAESLDIPKQK